MTTARSERDIINPMTISDMPKSARDAALARLNEKLIGFIKMGLTHVRQDAQQPGRVSFVIGTIYYEFGVPVTVTIDISDNDGDDTSSHGRQELWVEVTVTQPSAAESLNLHQLYAKDITEELTSTLRAQKLRLLAEPDDNTSLILITPLNLHDPDQ